MKPQEMLAKMRIYYWICWIIINSNISNNNSHHMISLTHIMKKLVTKNIHFGISPLTTAYKNQSTFCISISIFSNVSFSIKRFLVFLNWNIYCTALNWIDLSWNLFRYFKGWSNVSMGWRESWCFEPYDYII